jgi:RNA polymerase sigma-70 factor, ECF subfamily
VDPPFMALESSEPNSAGEAFRLWGENVWRSLRYFGVSPRQLSDATQDVFLIAHQRWSTFRGESARKAWVMGIARNVARDYRRRADKAPQVDAGRDIDVEAEPPDVADASCPAQRAAQRQLARLLDELLAQLPEEQRLLLVLVQIEGCSVPEAAATLNLPVRRARWLLEVAEQCLSAALKRHHDNLGRRTP